MAQLIFSPDWFALTDICIATLAAIACFLIAMRSFRIYNFSTESKHRYFSAAFALISAAFITQAATTLFALYGLFDKHSSGIAFYTFGILSSPQSFAGFGILAFRALMLAGLLGIFHVVEGNKNLKQVAITYFFAAVVVLMSIQHFFAFYAAVFVISGLITYKFYVNYINRPSGKTAALAAGFFLITLSQAGLVLAPLETVYTFASMIQLLGFSLLLATYIQLVKA